MTRSQMIICSVCGRLIKSREVKEGGKTYLMPNYHKDKSKVKCLGSDRVLPAEDSNLD